MLPLGRGRQKHKTIPYQDHACGQLDEQSTPVLRGSLYVQSVCSGIPEQIACPYTVRGTEKTETVNGKGCRKSVRMEMHGTSGRSNRRPQRGNNPGPLSARQPTADRKHQTMRLALRRRNPRITEVTGCGSPMANLGGWSLQVSNPVQVQAKAGLRGSGWLPGLQLNSLLAEYL